MSLFPFFTEDEEEENLDLEDEDLIEDEEEEIIAPYREYEIDLKTGRLTGRIVEGTEAVLSWVVLALKSERYQHEIYSWDYGKEFEGLIGNSYDPKLLKSEVRRIIEEALFVNEHITGINDLEVEQVNDTLHITFSLETDQGDEESGVEIDV